MAKKNPNLPWLLIALGAAIAFLYSQKETVMIYGSKALDAGKELLFKFALPERAQQYSDTIIQVAKEYSVDPFIIFAIGDRESNWGTQLDADMTGDHTPRNWGPYPMPPDGLGWGRGIMQVDYPRAIAENHDWRNVLENVRLGARIYQERVAEVSAPPSGSWTLNAAKAALFDATPGSYPALAVRPDLVSLAAMAAYNAGAANVRMAYSVATAVGSDPTLAFDAVTTGGNYSADVWTRMLAAVGRFDA